jgi:hypothetical protein
MAGDLKGAQNRARVGGSGFTVFTWDSKPILFAQQITHVAPQPVVQQGVVAIHPMDEPSPVELITPQAAGMGSLVLDLYELYGGQVWERLASYLGGDSKGVGTGNGPVDIVGIFQAVANTPTPIRIIKYIKPPQIRGKVMRPYTEEYHNCVISNVADGEVIQVGTMEVVKQLTVNYAYMTRGNRNPVVDGMKSSNLGGVSNSTTTSYS